VSAASSEGEFLVPDDDAEVSLADALSLIKQDLREQIAKNSIFLDHLGLSETTIAELPWLSWPDDWDSLWEDSLWEDSSRRPKLAILELSWLRIKWWAVRGYIALIARPHYFPTDLSEPVWLEIWQQIIDGRIVWPDTEPERIAPALIADFVQDAGPFLLKDILVTASDHRPKSSFLLRCGSSGWPGSGNAGGRRPTSWSG